MKKIVFCLSVFLLFVSCKGYVPFENENFEKNIFSEYFNIANCYFDLKKYDKAISYYKKASYDESLYSNAVYQIMLSYVELSDWNLAEKYCKDLLDISENDNTNIKSFYAYILSNNGKYKQAMAVYEEITAHGASKADLKNYINLLILEKDFPNASLKLSIYEKLFPDDDVSSMKSLVEKGLNQAVSSEALSE